MRSLEKPISHSLVIAFSEIPFEGLTLSADAKIEDLYREEELPEAPELEDLQLIFAHPIQIRAELFPVGSKLDIRGDFSTTLAAVCDRCAKPIETEVKASLTTFLMPRQQFSEHDKPGGKVIHGRTKGVQKSRHHSKSKAEMLLDAEGEHEDVNFGAFDGHMVDLRPLVREHLILQIPMTRLCSARCPGLCVVCGESIADQKCECPSGPTPVERDRKDDGLGTSLPL